MSEIRVDVYRSIPFQIEAVNTCLLDFERAQPRLIAGIFDDYAVLSGGIGEGTVVSCGMTVRGRLRPFEFRISEPIPSNGSSGSVIAHRIAEDRSVDDDHWCGRSSARSRTALSNPTFPPDR